MSGFIDKECERVRAEEREARILMAEQIRADERRAVAEEIAQAIEAERDRLDPDGCRCHGHEVGRVSYANAAAIARRIGGA